MRTVIGPGECDREYCAEYGRDPPPRVPPPPPILCGDCFRPHGTCDCSKVTWVDHAPIVIFVVLMAVGLWLKYFR